MKTSTVRFRRFSIFASTLLLLTSICAAFPVTGVVAASGPSRPLCQANAPLCTEVLDSIGYDGAYTGHDEPSLLFYSNRAGSGNSALYSLRIPTDPKVMPNQAGT